MDRGYNGFLGAVDDSSILIGVKGREMYINLAWSDEPEIKHRSEKRVPANRRVRERRRRRCLP
jgi:hypothetical protein